MIETKNMRVAMSEEQEIVNIMSNFGWNLQFSQDINTSDSHLERRGDEIYSVTHTEKYVKLVFNRNPDEFKDYARVCKLERDYFALRASVPVFQPILCIIGFFFFLFPAIIYAVSYNKKKKDWQVRMETEGVKMLQEARRLI